MNFVISLEKTLILLCKLTFVRMWSIISVGKLYNIAKR